MIGICKQNSPVPPQNQMKRKYSIGVDSGMAGFIASKDDYSEKERDELFNYTHNNTSNEVFLRENEFFSYTAYGDGGYPVLIHDTKDGIDAIYIKFI